MVGMSLLELQANKQELGGTALREQINISSPRLIVTPVIQHLFVSEVGLKLIVGVKRAMPTYSLVVDGKGWGTRVMT